MLAMLLPTHSYSTVRIDGGTNVEERQQRVDNFNNLNMGQVLACYASSGSACPNTYSCGCPILDIRLRRKMYDTLYLLNCAGVPTVHTCWWSWTEPDWRQFTGAV